MPNRNTLSALLIALIITIVVAVFALILALIFSATGSGAGGIGVYAGGLSQKFISLLALCLPVIFVILFLILRRARS
jgi:uncharacterized membrane protein